MRPVDEKLFNKLLSDEVTYNYTADDCYKAISFINKIRSNKEFNATDIRRALNFLFNVHNLPDDIYNYYLNYINFLNKNEFKLHDHLYNSELLSVKFNVTINEAENIITKYKKDKATSKEGFIKRHGKKEGYLKFKKFQDTSNWVTEYKENTKNEEASVKFRESSKRCVEYYLKRNYSLKEAQEAVSMHQKINSGVHEEYYRNRGYSEKEIAVKFKKINSKKKVNKEFFKKKYGDKWRDFYIKLNLKKSTNSRTKVIDDPFLNYQTYYFKVMRYTNTSLIKWGHTISNLSKRSYKFHLDHIYSIRDGFNNKIDPKYVGHITNLRIITSIENFRKGSTSGKTLKKLMLDYNVWNNEHENS